MVALVEEVVVGTFPMIVLRMSWLFLLLLLIRDPTLPAMPRPQ